MLAAFVNVYRDEDEYPNKRLILSNNWQDQPVAEKILGYSSVSDIHSTKNTKRDPK